MPDINITVAHKVAVSDTQTIVCDNSDYMVHWTLDEEWSAYDTKTMRTIYMDGTFKDTVFSGNTIALPVCTVPGVVQIGLFAGNLRTSRVAILRALPSVRSGAGAPADPTPDVYDQLMELIKGLGGADPDDIAKAVADYLAAHPIEETDPTVPEWAKAEITGATVGQIAKIAAVDASGVPTAWSPVDMPTGGGDTWELINEVTLSEDAMAVVFDKDKSGAAFALRKFAVVGMTKGSNASNTGGGTICINVANNADDRYSIVPPVPGHGALKGDQLRYWHAAAESFAENGWRWYLTAADNTWKTGQGTIGTKLMEPPQTIPKVATYLSLWSRTSGDAFAAGSKIELYGVRA